MNHERLILQPYLEIPFRSFFQQANTSDILLIVQCDSGDDSDNLLACARYTIQGELQHANDKTSAIHVVLLIQLPGIASGRFTGFQVILVNTNQTAFQYY